MSKSNLHRKTFVNLLRVTFFLFVIVSYFETFFCQLFMLGSEKLLHYSIIQLSEFCLVTFESDKSFLGGKKKQYKKFQNARKKSFDVHPRKVRPCKSRKATSTHFPNGKSKKEKNIGFFFLKLFNTFFLLL